MIKKTLKRLRFLGILYLVNDLTALLLKKKRTQERQELARLRKILYFVIVLLLISVAINIFLYFIYV